MAVFGILGFVIFSGNFQINLSRLLINQHKY